MAEDGATIATSRMILRRARASDLEAIHAILSLPEAMRYWSTPEHETLEETRLWLHSMITATTSDEFVLEMGGRVIGKAGAWRLPEIGYILHPDYWRQGLMREALEAILPWLFARHPVTALTAEADPRNRASCALLEQLGFVETHRAQNTMQWRDEWCDSVYFSLPRSPNFLS
ncbi:GNAT family N-acetyltransferase [Thioclava sp. FR2]|uniref:GNAT family N-acetyltransferase n=1 Tax=Thioclava sp. FR2 TaxID=3445780 RepID=UPI003EBDE989